MPPRSKPATARGKKKAAAPLPTAIVKRETSKNGKVIDKILFNPNQKCPYVISRVLRPVEGPRYARRPSYVAKKNNVLDAASIAWADEWDQPECWTEVVDMPFENNIRDCGWVAGPATRPLPAFKGPKPGPTDRSLTHSCPPSAFVDTQLTPEFKEKAVQYTKDHCKAWRASHPNWRADCIEMSVRKYKTMLNKHTFDHWMACKIRVAQLQPEIPALSLWSQKSSLFDPQVFACMTFNQFQWLNRHCSFASVDENEQSAEAEAEVARRHDTHRKRRELTDLVCAAVGKAWHPHQQLGLDEGVREHKHWGKQRISWKAACHSGSLVDCLNDCLTKYCVWFEEHHWVQKHEQDNDPHTLPARFKRAAQVLLDAGKHP